MIDTGIDPKGPGLCKICSYGRRIPGRASTFWLCRRSERDATFPRYPRLPVRACRGYEAIPKRQDEDEPNL